MANILGKAGRFASDEAGRLRAHTLIIGFVMIGMLGVLEGMTLSSLWSKLNPPAWLTVTVQWGIIALVTIAILWGWRKMDALETNRRKWQRGADGESVVGKLIAKFPDTYYVINDINTGAGNLDHVVVGPTGVFVLDAKNWRGMVQADGTGELLLNGRRTDKAYIRQFEGRLMGMRARVCELSPGTDDFFRGVFVFTAASVDRIWGKTRQIHCMKEDQLWGYIVENKREKTLTKEAVGKIAQAFLELAQREKDFTDQAPLAVGGNVGRPMPQSSSRNTFQRHERLGRA